MNDIADAIRSGLGQQSPPKMGVGIALPGMRVSMAHFQHDELEQIRQQAKPDEQQLPPAAVQAAPAAAETTTITIGTAATAPSSGNPIEEYKAIQAQIAELQSRAAVLHQESRLVALAQVRQLIGDYDLGMSEIGCWPSVSQGSSTRPRAPRGNAVAKFYDPSTGNSWSGNGRVPEWLKNKDRALYAIQKDSKP